MRASSLEVDDAEGVRTGAGRLLKRSVYVLYTRRKRKGAGGADEKKGKQEHKYMP
jgi:hypothetical protein